MELCAEWLCNASPQLIAWAGSNLCLLQTSGIGKLKQGKDLLQKQIERQKLSVQQLVKEHFGRIAKCQETVVSAAAYMSRTELARREHVSTQSTLAHVSQASATAILLPWTEQLRHCR